MVNQKATCLSELSEQFFSTSQVLHAMSSAMLSEKMEGEASFPLSTTRDRLALESVCQQLCKLGVLDDARVRSTKVYFRAPARPPKRINLAALWSK